MPALDTLPRKDMLSVFNQLAKKLYAIQSARDSMENVQSLCRERQEKYEKSMRTIRIIIILLCVMIFSALNGGIMFVAYLLQKYTAVPIYPQLFLPITIGILVIISLIPYKFIKKKKQKALAEYLNNVRPYIPFFESIMQEAANDCYAFCTRFGIPSELQKYEAAAYIYTDLSTSASLPLYVAIENYRNYKHRQEMQAYAAEQNALIQQKMEQDKAYYDDMLREASRSNELLQRGNEQRQDLYNYVRYGY